MGGVSGIGSGGVNWPESSRMDWKVEINQLIDLLNIAKGNIGSITDRQRYQLQAQFGSIIQDIPLPSKIKAQGTVRYAQAEFINLSANWNQLSDDEKLSKLQGIINTLQTALIAN